MSGVGDVDTLMREKTLKERRGKKMDNLYAKDFKDNLKKTLRNVISFCFSMLYKSSLQQEAEYR